MNNIIWWVYSSAIIALLAASIVVVSRNLINKLLAFIITVVATASLWLLLNAEFLALTLVLIYLGAVVVLFLMVIMLFELKLPAESKLINKVNVGSIAIASIIFILLAYSFHTTTMTQAINILVSDSKIDDLVQLGVNLFTEQLLPITITGMLLLMAIVATISLLGKEVKS